MKSSLKAYLLNMLDDAMVLFDSSTKTMANP